MTSPAAAAERIRESGIIAIVRGDFSPPELQALAEALHAGGIEVLEITLNSAGALAAIRDLAARLEGRLLLGAGTVLTEGAAGEAIDAGAAFVVSPGLDAGVVARVQARGVLCMPGVYTPSEVQAALRLGCRLLKLFPSDLAGPAHLRALRAPFNDVGFVPTGGINVSNIGAYAEAGAVAVGVGGSLVKRGVTPAEVEVRARALVIAWREACAG